MRKATITILVGILILVIAGPVLAAQLKQPEKRILHGVSLKELEYTEINFTNLEQDLELAGMLFVPHGAGPFPAVVIIHGGGTSRRDNDWYLSMVSHLQSNGVLVLLPDKRGSEKSAGDWRTASFEDLATDTLAAVQYLLGQDRYPISNVGLVGCSQGGQIAPVAASMSSEVDFVINIVGAGIPLREVFYYEENNNLRQMGFLPGISDLVSRLSAAYIMKVSQKEFWQSAGEFDPLPYWQQVSVPVLAMYGELDTNVPAEASALRLESLNKPNLEVVIYPGSGHPLEDPVGQGERNFRLEALEKMRDFIIAAGRVSYPTPQF